MQVLASLSKLHAKTGKAIASRYMNSWSTEHEATRNQLGKNKSEPKKWRLLFEMLGNIGALGHMSFWKHMFCT